jgi:hypothetical protein
VRLLTYTTGKLWSIGHNLQYSVDHEDERRDCDFPDIPTNC